MEMIRREKGETGLGRLKLQAGFELPKHSVIIEIINIVGWVMKFNT